MNAETIKIINKIEGNATPKDSRYSKASYKFKVGYIDSIKILHLTPH